MTDMRVEQKNIGKLFSDMQGRKFIIPKYQRPYNWDTEKCQILWDDLCDNFSNMPDTDYFMGTIVTCKNEGNLEVIDGQQRLTTFSILLRAFYTKLESMPDSDEVRGLKRQIEKCLWDTDEISEKVKDKANVRIHSDVSTEKDNITFNYILQNGVSPEYANNYSRNYRFFQEACDEFARKTPLHWYKFCSFILRKCVLLPIECDDRERALTIFFTLNNRGMPLSDADIFKAELFKVAANPDEFIKQWGNLSEICESTKDNKGNYDFTIDDIFMYYMQVLRGRKDDKDTTNIGLRKFYLNNANANLLSPGLMSEIVELAEFWKSADGYNGKYKISDAAMKWFHCLWCFPNTIWVYPVSAYFLTHKSTEHLDVFLKKLCAFLYAKYIYTPSLSGVKGAVYALDAEICKGRPLSSLNGNFIDDNNIEYEMDKFTNTQVKQFSRGLLTIDAYLNPKQTELLNRPERLEIEHILPKKWCDANYDGWTEQEAANCLEKFGNKVVIEKRLNIQAGNGYFGQKKIKYSKSKIANVQELAALETNDWSRDELLARDKEFKERIINFFKSELK